MRTKRRAGRPAFLRVPPNQGPVCRMPEDDKTERPATASHLAQTIQTVLALQAREEEQASGHQLAIERVTRRLGRPHTVYATLSLLLVWATLNAVVHAMGLRAPDPPPFPWMQAFVSACALLMTVVVLTAQNRQAAVAERRGHLDLQVNLLAEQKIAKLIALVEELRRDLPSVRPRRDSVAEAMKNTLDPEVVIAALDGSAPLDPGPDEGPPEGTPKSRG
jgi:uncharacterized membrane protein